MYNLLIASSGHLPTVEDLESAMHLGYYSRAYISAKIMQMSVHFTV